MTAAGFEPAIPAVKRLQNWACDRTVTVIGECKLCKAQWNSFLQQIKI